MNNNFILKKVDSLIYLGGGKFLFYMLRPGFRYRRKYKRKYKHQQQGW